ncbi:unnamed protein product [Phyllotreta striolata]|uniref:Uncharacterized protein n=1 Tax=Phyllotreta striolata TaxID=444603 RepID=A0A9N9TJD0_PHYSR|nr:unnamed protein product [Phyllotreta striolata]
MKSENPNNIVYKEVVIIGNGPSGIVLSYMLSGNVPYVTSDSHPDEMLSARLGPIVGDCLLYQDFSLLSSGLEGRSTNRVSLLMDALLHPHADMGWDLEPLVEFRKTGAKIDHIVLGKGPPGGSWHRMDPQMLTLSLGSWMALPGMPFHSSDSEEKRAYAADVAKYYVQYTDKMGLAKNFRNGVTVDSVDEVKRSYKSDNWVDKLNNEIKGTLEACMENEENRSRNVMRDGFRRNLRNSRCKCDGAKRNDKKRSISFCCDTSDFDCDRFYSSSMNEKLFRNSFTLDYNKVPSYNSAYRSPETNWIVNCSDANTGEKITYACKYLVLANGSSDSPNRLEVSKTKADPAWMLYDLGNLESRLDSYLTLDPEDVDPVLVIGAGLSAADAIMAVRGRNVPVIHVFRQRSPELSRHLQENLYPEYHKVHQMMLDPSSIHPYYTAYPEYTLTDFDADARTVILTSKEGVSKKINVSFAVILIGSRPDFAFLPKHYNLAARKHLSLDCKTNTADIDRLTYGLRGFDNLFAIGPIAGDNFVRFLPGGALAVTAELYKNRNPMRI